MHGRLDLPDLPPVFREFAMMPLASISNAQRTPVPGRTGMDAVSRAAGKSIRGGLR